MQYTVAYHVSKVIHSKSESKQVSIGIVLLNVLPIGEPDKVPLQLFKLGAVRFIMLPFPQGPLFNKLELWLHTMDSGQAA